MNTLHPTATDECDNGLHAFVNGRCRDCGALAEKIVAPKPRTTQSVRFVVSFELDDFTRWREDDQDTARGLLAMCEMFGRLWTRGPIPAVTVSVYHGTEPAGRHESANESAPAHHLNHGTDGVSSVLSLPTPSCDLICPKSDNPKA